MCTPVSVHILIVVFSCYSTYLKFVLSAITKILGHCSKMDLTKTSDVNNNANHMVNQSLVMMHFSTLVHKISKAVNRKMQNVLLIRPEDAT